MGLFNFILKRILYKIPLKLLLIITIALILLLLLNSKVFATTDVTLNFDYNGVDKTTNVSLPYDNYNLFKTYNGSQAIYRLLNWSSTDSQNLYGSFRDNYRFMTLRYENNNYFQSALAYSYNEQNNTFDSYTLTNGRDLLIGNANVFTSSNPATIISLQNNANIYTTNSAETNWLTNDNGLIPLDFVDPYISDTSSIDDMSFNYLMIEGGSEDFYFINTSEIQRQRIFDLELDYQGYTYVMNINDYAIVSSSGDSVGFAIPKYALFPQLIFRNGETLSFSLVVTPSIRPNSTGDWSVYSLGTFTLTLTSEQEQQLEEDRQAQQIDNIQNGINNINNSVTNVNNSVNNLTDAVTDSDIDDDYADDFLDLSTNFAVEDPTSLDQIFMILYNAFCEDEIEDLTFTMPFTNQQVTISQQNISARYPQAVKSIVAVFVWGIIGLFVLKDIRSSVNKIAEGSPEDVGSDVKKEVL